MHEQCYQNVNKRHCKTEVANSSVLLIRYFENLDKILKKLIS